MGNKKKVKIFTKDEVKEMKIIDNYLKLARKFYPKKRKVTL